MAEIAESPVTFQAAPRRVLFDGATIFGLVGGLALVIAAIAFGGSAGAFLNFPGLLIVLGGTLAVTTMSFSMADVSRALAVLHATVFYRERNGREVAYTMLELAEFCKRQGVLRMGELLDRFGREPFLHKALALVVEGLPDKDISDILSEDLNAQSARSQRAANVLRKAAEVAPAMGLIGTLIGLVQMLGNLENPSAIGPAMAVALLTTFYGVLLANMVFNPLAAKLERNAAEEHLIRYLQCLGVLAIARKDNPRRLEMLLNSALPPEAKVRFYE